MGAYSPSLPVKRQPTRLPQPASAAAPSRSTGFLDSREEGREVSTGPQLSYYSVWTSSLVLRFGVFVFFIL